MWIRKLEKRGTSMGVVLPPEVLDALAWERGDYLQIRMTDLGSLVLTRIDPLEISDRARGKLEPLPIIKIENN